jgi:hypothetical protein
MKSYALASLFLSAALGVATLPARALEVTAVTVEPSPRSSSGPCPAEITFRGKVALNKRGTFTFRWERSDGAVDTTVHPPVAYDGSHAALVTTTWTLGAALPAFHPFHGWMVLHVLTPSDRRSERASFTLDCGPPPPKVIPGAPGGPGLPGGRVPVPLPGGGSPQGCQGSPDLVPLLHTPMNGWVAVKNVGTGNAGPSRLLLKCVKDGHTGPGGGCVDLPASAIVPPFFSTPEALGMNVPALACGKQFAATMPAFKKTSWPKGTYRFTATADATNAVAESNEGNNVATSTLVR